MNRKYLFIAALAVTAVALGGCSALFGGGAGPAQEPVIVQGPAAFGDGQIAALPQAEKEVAYRLGPSDEVRITVFGEDNLSGEFEIDGSGQVALPLVGEIKVAGLTLRDAEDNIETTLEQGFLLNPRVNIEVLNYRPIFILGEVREPGSYPYQAGMTVLKAVTIAGGYTYRARKSTVYVKRADDPEQEQTATPDTEILPGDIVRVAERFF